MIACFVRYVHVPSALSSRAAEAEWAAQNRTIRTYSSATDGRRRSMPNSAEAGNGPFPARAGQEWAATSLSVCGGSL